MPIVNVIKLDRELRAAGIPIEGVSSDGRIDYADSATPAQRIQGAALLAAHDPTDYAEQNRQARLAEAVTAAKASLNGKPALGLVAAELRTLVLVLAAREGWIDGNGKMNIP